MIALNLRDRSVAELAGPLWLNQAAPLGWLGLQRILLLQFGADERTLRALPVLFGIATLWLACWAGRRWMGPLGAALFTLLCSLGLYLSFFPLETKHYSGDVFFGLLLPVLAVWSLEDGRDTSWRRIFVWWMIATVAQWLANGALFAAPACAGVIFIAISQRAGVRKAVLAVLPGLALAVSFSLHYWLSLRHALRSEDLQNYWWHAFPPAGAGIGGTLRWLVSEIGPLAVNPGGTSLASFFWLAVAYGIAVALRRRLALGLMLLALPASALVFAALRLVPLGERLSLWVLPVLYAAIAIAGDAAASAARGSFTRRNWTGVAMATPFAAVALLVSADIVRVGAYELRVRPRSNHSLDDRSALRFLMDQRQPGDVLVTVRMGLPAVWWYGGINVAPPNLGRTYAQDGAPVLEVRHHSPGPECRASDLATALDGRSRVAVHLGFDSRIPAGFQEQVLDTLSARGRLTAYRKIAEEGVAAVFDLREAPAPWTVLVARPGGMPLEDIRRPAGCARFYPATRW